MKSIEDLIQHAEQVLTRLEACLPNQQLHQPDWHATAWRWVRVGAAGELQAVKHPHALSLDDIQNVDEQKAELVRNTRQFVQGLPANHVLLTGARGTGKSTLVKAVLNTFSAQGLRLIEVQKHDLLDLPQIVALIENRPEKFIIYCDDLSFEAGETGYKALKVVLDGSIAVPSDNVLVYATSNRKHMLPEFMAENLQTQYLGEEIRPGESTEEKISLSERFGLWLSFYPFDQQEYLTVAQTWLSHYGVAMDAAAQQAALQFALIRGARSGRVAHQFARDYAGRLGLPAQ